ncbi:hypothetical protein JAAARDRAFT_328996 [Jaapia argillacea MUCL 33604]|uniref:Aip3p/Bud6 N-terminal domain-containing protein n=1 Tax=Jaapia argillacea MUCL 33604 TaxID=933084 RepID=A0A067PPM6_9AGAM|nr:hypothetical protein JAAARDRAFT_328996 [Jaapia argillacea MUCL 33604]
MSTTRTPSPTSSDPPPTPRRSSRRINQSGSGLPSPSGRERRSLEQRAVESSVTRLLLSIKTILESLTLWSCTKISENDVSDAYVRLGNDFNAAVSTFAVFGISMDLEIMEVPERLREVLELCLAEDATPANLQMFLPEVRAIITTLLTGLRTKQTVYRQMRSEHEPKLTDSTAIGLQRTESRSSWKERLKNRPAPQSIVGDQETGLEEPARSSVTPTRKRYPSSRDPSPPSRDPSPSARDPSPSAGDPSPSSRDPSPSSRGPSPSSRDRSSAPGDPSTSSKGPSPTSRGPSPTLRDPSPSSRDPSPTPRDPSPSSRDHSPAPRDPSPSSRGPSPSSSVSSPFARGPSPSEESEDSSVGGLAHPSSNLQPNRTASVSKNASKEQSLRALAKRYDNIPLPPIPMEPEQTAKFPTDSKLETVGRPRLPVAASLNTKRYGLFDVGPISFPPQPPIVTIETVAPSTAEENSSESQTPLPRRVDSPSLELTTQPVASSLTTIEKSDTLERRGSQIGNGVASSLPQSYTVR